MPERRLAESSSSAAIDKLRVAIIVSLPRDFMLVPSIKVFGKATMRCCPPPVHLGVCAFVTVVSIALAAPGLRLGWICDIGRGPVVPSGKVGR